MRSIPSFRSLSFFIALSTLSQAFFVPPQDASRGRGSSVALAAHKRSLPDSPTNGYAPAPVDCPSERPTIRSASELSQQETSWLELRRSATVEPMKSFLSRLAIPDFDASAYVENNRNNASALPNVGLAFSGGGYRAMMTGGGVLKAFDDRTENSTMPGHLGGLLQSATYIAGLSGGSWLVGSIYINNFTSVSLLQAELGESVWELGNSIVQGPAKSGLFIKNTADYFDNIADAVSSKRDAGYETTVTDYWGRALSYQLINATDGGPAYTWSSLQENPVFQSGNAPMPIVVADGRAPGELLIPSNTTVYEFNPWEMGTFDPTTYGFAPLRYLASAFAGGVLPDNETCIRGFDNAGYVMGTSSSLFNQFLLQIGGTELPQVLASAITRVLERFSSQEEDIADYTPNPFYHWNNETNLNAQSKQLTLVDGGEDLQNVPLNPLIQPVRAVDVIFAVDSSADTEFSWPNGTALVATYNRSTNAAQQNGTAFPAIPDQNTFVNLGLNTRPTFFGCDSSNLTGPAPLIVYIPNAPYVYQSNVSTFDPSYNNTERDAIILNGYNVATMANGTVDQQWPVCVACAVLSRSLERTETTVPSACQECFQRYCWNGTTESAPPPNYNPTYKLAPISVKASSATVTSPWFWLASIAAGSSGLLNLL
ncbi:MAG: Lysophospholipase 1 [Caeruleum heppii]|nr:MAG: Lysophospholipase 1 [Caeruleum heppii]